MRSFVPRGLVVLVVMERSLRIKTRGRVWMTKSTRHTPRSSDKIVREVNYDHNRVQPFGDEIINDSKEG